MIIEKLGTWKFKLDIYCIPSWLRTFRPLRITISRPIGLILPSPGLKIVYIYIYLPLVASIIWNHQPLGSWVCLKTNGKIWPTGHLIRKSWATPGFWAWIETDLEGKSCILRHKLWVKLRIYQVHIYLYIYTIYTIYTIYIYTPYIHIHYTYICNIYR